MIIADLHPGLPFFLGALVVLVTPLRYRWIPLLLTPLLGFINLMGWEFGTTTELTFLGFTLNPVRVDRLSYLFGILFHIAAFLGILFSLHLKDRMQHIAGLCYAGSAIGAVFAGDLLTLFIFWELLALTSSLLIFARREPRAFRSGTRYLIFQVGSGVLLLAGTIVYFNDSSSLLFEHIGLTSTAGWLIFLAFGIKSAFPLLHNWLTDAYPEATPTGTVFLSAFTTKVAVYALARGFPGTELLIYIGVTMTCFPIFYAVIENDLRRVLAYSMINQIGFMICGIGIGTELAINGAISHAFNDVIFKSLLMMTMGAVLFRTGKINGSDLGGLYKSMPKTAAFCLIGAASISAFPLFSGFVSKSMVMAAALEEGYHWVWIGLLFASAGVFHHAGIKIPFFAFFSHDAGIRVKEAPTNMLFAMGLAALLCIGIGSYPWILYDLLPFPVSYLPFDNTHVIAQLQLLFFSALAFVWLKLSGIYPPELRSINLDFEWVYRKLVPTQFSNLVSAYQRFAEIAHRLWVYSSRRLEVAGRRLHGPDGQLSKTWMTGSMIVIVLLTLSAVLLKNLL